MSLVQFSDESLGYGGAPVLTGVNFALKSSDKVAILGRSGAGKSTLLTAIDEKLVSSGRRVALVPQELALVPQLSVVKNTLMGRLDDHGALYNLRNLLRTHPSDRAAVLSILANLDLTNEADRPTEGISGGQKQRAALARAFFRGGDVLIGDEPFSALDETQARALLQQAKDRFQTMVFALHNVQQALDFATRIIGLRNGCVEIDAPSQSVRQEDLYALYHP